jgi:hypothetical protein
MLTLCAAWASPPKARAGCGKPARPDLWRGLWANHDPYSNSFAFPDSYLEIQTSRSLNLPMPLLGSSHLWSGAHRLTGAPPACALDDLSVAPASRAAQDHVEVSRGAADAAKVRGNAGSARPHLLPRTSRVTKRLCLCLRLQICLTSAVEASASRAAIRRGHLTQPRGHNCDKPL